MFEGRWLRVITVVVQATVLVAFTGLILGTQWLPIVLESARAGDAGRLGWMAYWPPAWFLGLFQLILGAPQGRPVFEALAMPALAMSLVAVCVCVPRDAVAVAACAARAGVGRARRDAWALVVDGATPARMAGAPRRWTAR